MNTAKTNNTRVYKPLVDIYEQGDAIILIADMPGVGADAIDLTLEKKNQLLFTWT